MTAVHEGNSAPAAAPSAANGGDVTPTSAELHTPLVPRQGGDVPGHPASTVVPAGDYNGGSGGGGSSSVTDAQNASIHVDNDRKRSLDAIGLEVAELERIAHREAETLLSTPTTRNMIAKSRLFRWSPRATGIASVGKGPEAWTERRNVADPGARMRAK